jgi:hypothetical protein
MTVNQYDIFKLPNDTTAHNYYKINVLLFSISFYSAARPVFPCSRVVPQHLFSRFERKHEASELQRTEQGEQGAEEIKI